MPLFLNQRGMYVLRERERERRRVLRGLGRFQGRTYGEGGGGSLLKGRTCRGG